MKSWKHLSILTALLLAGSGCDFGTPAHSSGGGTGVEGLSGTLVTPTGTPAVGAQVRVYAVTGSGAQLSKSASDASTSDAAVDTAIVTATATTSATGTFQFKNLANGIYNVAAAFQSGDTTLSVFIRSVVVAGNTTLGTDTLRVSGGISVQVRTAGGTLPGATCLIPASPWQAVSDASGNCVLVGLPPGMFQITVSYPGLVLFVSGNLTVSSGTVSNAGTFTWPGSTPTAESFRATINMYSGLTDPVFVLHDTAHAEVNLRLQGLCTPTRVADSAAQVPNQVPSLGYRGVQVARVAGTETNWQGTALVYGGSVRIFHANPPSVCAEAMQGITQDIYLPDAGRRIELLLLAYARDAGALTPTQHESIVAAINATLTPTPEPTDTIPPPAPTLINPNAGSVNLPASPTFYWDSLLGVTGYHFQLVDSNFPGIPLVDDSSLTTNYRVAGPLEYLVTYQWRVRARNAAGWGEWSAYASLFRDNMPVVTVPGTPVLSSPAAFATGLSLTPTFVWGKVNAAVSYHLQVYADTTFTNPVVNDTVPETVTAGTLVSRVAGPLTDNAVYYWRVRAWNTEGAGVWSDTRRFTTGSDSSSVPELPPAPVLSAPANGATGVSTTPTLSWQQNSWNDSVNPHFRLQVATDSLFAVLVADDSIPPFPTTGIGISVSRAVGPLAPGTAYYWRVSARNTAGVSAYTTVWRFTTGTTQGLPAAPTLLSPANGQFTAPATMLEWSSVPTATRYHVQIALETTFANPILNDTAVTGTTRGAGFLVNGTTHYWRVRAANAQGDGPFSAVWSFVAAAVLGD